MRKTLFLLMVVFALGIKNSAAQIDFENFDVNQIMGKVLTVKKGWAPKFFLGKQSIPKIPIVAQILGSKNNININKYFKTFKTGRTVYRITSYAGTAVALYGTIKNISNNSKDSVLSSAKNQAKTALYSGLGSMASGVLVKLLTKAASYKAVDLFGGAIKKKLSDIISFDLGAANNFGRPGYKAGLIVHL